MNRRDFLKFLGGAAAAAAVAPQALAAAIKDPGPWGFQGPIGVSGPQGPPANLAPGFIVLEPGMSVQQAIDSLPKDGGTVYISSGTYIVNQKITIPDGVSLVAEGSLTISGCTFEGEARAAGDAPITLLMEEDDQVTIMNNTFNCKEVRSMKAWFETPIGDHLTDLREKMQRLYLKAKQLVI
jgi:hypothetical protein